MTTLKNKIVKTFIAGILLCIFVFSILISFLISKVSDTYIEQTQYIKPEKIKNEFEYIMAENNTQLISKRLLEYSKDENVNIEVLDKDNNYVLRVDGRNSKEDDKFITKNYRLISPINNRYVGKLRVTYQKQNDAIEYMKTSFARSVIIAIIISVLIGIVTALFLSTNIIQPIKSISDATLKIRNGDYDINLEESFIKELENLQQNIKYLSINLKNQEEIRKQYAQDISHELRTPLTNLQLYIEAMKDDIIDADDESLTSILEEVTRLRGLVTDLNKTFQDNYKYFKVNMMPFNLSNQLKNISKVFMPRAKSLNIEIHEHIKQNIFLNSDKEKINQVIQNLLSNAIKAIGNKGNIDIILKEHKNQIIIEIIDDGIGIEKEKIPFIFGRFYRIDDVRNTKENGHGLGLSISKNFIETLGGKIKVESEINKGAKFSIIFSK